MGFWDWLIGLFKKKARLTRVVVYSASVDCHVGQTVNIRGILMEEYAMVWIPNKSVTVKVTDPEGVVSEQTVTTNDSGEFAASFVANKVGFYVVNAYFAGEGNKYQPSSAQVTVEVQPAPQPVATVLTLTASHDTVIVGDTVTITATLSAQ